MDLKPNLSGNTSKLSPLRLSRRSTGYVTKASSDDVRQLTMGRMQNFSKFLVKDGKVKWYAAKTTKVVSLSDMKR